MFGNGSLKLAFAGATDPGKARDHNEDAYAIVDERATAVVADGMGGLARGEVASALVIESVMSAVAERQSVEQGLLTAHRRIRETSQAAGQERMGSTAVAVAIENDKATIHWVGDSRAYLLRGGSLRTLTKDHSFVNELIDAGAISARDAETHPNRHVLTRAVGIRDVAELKIDSVTERLRPGDRLLLCSDGLYGYLPAASLLRVLASAGDAQSAVQQLVESTLRESSAEDNVTAVCLIVGG